MKKLTIAAFAALLFAGCASTDSSNSDNVKQAEVWQHYWVEYDGASDQLTSGATFRFGGSTGTTLILNGASKVKFDGNDMGHSSGELIKGLIGGTHYRFEGKGFKPEYTFEYTNNDGKSYTNKIGISKLAPDDVPEILDANGQITFNFSLPPVAPGEKLTIELRNDSGFTSIDDAIITGNNAVISGEKLTNLGNGPVEITFTKRKEGALQQAEHLGGDISFTYKTKAYGSKVINVKKPTESVKPTDNTNSKTTKSDTI